MQGDRTTPYPGQEEWPIGARVQHPAWGEGTVMAYRDSGALRVKFGLNSRVIYPGSLTRV